MIADELDEPVSDMTAEQVIAELVAEVERLRVVNTELLAACREIDKQGNAEKAGCKCPYCQTVRLYRAAVAMAETETAT